MATNGVRCSYQEVVDLHTESDRVTAIGIHTPTGSFPRQMFKGFFDMYKKFRYIGCSISLVPAARLPADPSMVSYEGGEPPLDARDLMNPIMFHGCHGDDLGGVLNRLYGDNGAVSDSLDGIEISSTGVLMDPEYATMERLYYKALTDKTWKKAHPMRGFRKSGLRPLLYSLAVNRQIMPSSLDTGLPNRQMFGFDDENDLDIAFGDPTTDYETSGKTVTFQTRNNLQFSTPRLTGLGWLDTRQVLTTAVPFDIESGVTPEEVIDDVSKAFAVNYTELPKLFMGVILLPPAYKTEQYFRMIINHYFAFKNFRGVSFQPDVTSVPTYWNKNGDGTEPYDVIGDLEQGHLGPLHDGEGESPIPPGPEPDPPEPPVEVVPCGILIHASFDTEDDFEIKNGTVSYIPPGGDTPISLGPFSRSANTGEPVRFNGFGCPVGSTIIVEGDVWEPDQQYFMEHVVFSSQFSGPVTTTMPLFGESKTYKTNAASPWDVVSATDVYGWLGYCYYTYQP